MQTLVKEAKDFIRKGHPGECKQLESAGKVIAKAAIIATKKQGQVDLIENLPVSYPHHEERFFKLVKDAQNVPGALNVLAVTSPWRDDHENLEAALFGIDYDTWEPDIPKKGLWADARHSGSQVVAFFSCPFDTDVFSARLWFRPGAVINDASRALLEQVFGG
jgi:hypothetical protein